MSCTVWSAKADLAPPTAAMRAIAGCRIGAAREVVEHVADDPGGSTQDRSLTRRGHAHANFMGVAAAVEPDGELCPLHLWHPIQEDGESIRFGSGEACDEIERHWAIAGEIVCADRASVMHERYLRADTGRV